MTRIKNIGNKPEDWKSYIDFLKLNSALDIVQSRHLSDAYSNAFSVIITNIDCVVFCCVFSMFYFCHVFYLCRRIVNGILPSVSP